MCPQLHAIKSGISRGSESGEVERGNIPRHRAIYEELLSEIQTGVYQPGERLPSEALLCERFNASRITVAKAFENLQRAGLVVRRPGSGTYVERPPESESMRFGVLIPELGTTDIFEPICQGILSTPAAKSHSLAWGNTSDLARSPKDGAESLCRQYISQRVNGVFFAPVEYAQDKDRTNRRIADMFARASIPVVLLDRCLERYPDRCEFDLVGIDNQRAGFILTRHLLNAGAKRIIFAGRPNSAPTVDARAAGYREALYALQDGSHGKVIFADFEDSKFVKHMLDRERPDGIVCANDVTAAKLMGTIIALGKRVPEDIRMVGLDDVSYAKYLPTPLTTMRQDCAEIGAVAMSVMLERIKRPNHPVMDVRVKTELVVRASCGTIG